MKASLSTPPNQYDMTLHKINQIPDSYRHFTIPHHDVKSLYGIDDAALNELKQRGLKHRNNHYDRYDLGNIALYHSFFSIQKMAMRSWSGTLKRSENQETLKAHIQYVVEEKTLKPGDTISLLLPNKGKTSLPFQGNSNLISLDYIQKPISYKFTDIYQSLLLEIDTYNFFMLPEEVRWNPDFIEEHKICECGGASKKLLQMARALNIKTRHQFGILLAKPYSTCHYWVEFKIEGQWLAADPLLLKILKRITGLKPDIWTYNTSPNALFIPLLEIDRYNPSTGAPILKQFQENEMVVNPITIHAGKELSSTLCTDFIG